MTIAELYQLRIQILSVALAVIIGFAVSVVPLSVSMLVAGLCIFAVLLIQTPIVTLVLLLVVAPLRTLIATESNWTLPLDVGQLLLIIYLGIWVAYQIYRQSVTLIYKKSPVLVASVLLVIVLGTNSWSANAIGAWLTEWLKWIIIAVFVWQMLILYHNSWQWVVSAIIVSAVANALVGLYIFFGGSGADHLVIGGRFFRAFGTFGQPNPFGGFMGIVLPLSLMCLLHTTQNIIKSFRLKYSIRYALGVWILCSGATFIIFAALIASWSRGAWLGFTISLAVMAFALPRKLAHSLAISITVIIMISSSLFVGIVPESIVNRITTAATDFITIEEIRGVDIDPINYAVVERIAHWQAAINMAEANPLVGVGLGNYEITYNDYRLLNWKEALGHAHNYYLNIVAETGIIGGLGYLMFWIVIFVVSWQVRGHPDRCARSLGIGLLGTWSYIAVHSIFDNLYVNNLFLHIGVLLGILAILHQEIWATKTLE